MSVNKYYDSDCNLGVLDGKTVAVIGFGSQGHAHSENLAESGVNVVVGLRKGSSHWEKASQFAETCPNFHVMEVEEAAKAGDIVMMLVPDELCADIYNKQIAPYMTEGKTLAFAHGFNIHFKTIVPPITGILTHIYFSSNLIFQSIFQSAEIALPFPLKMR